MPTGIISNQNRPGANTVPDIVTQTLAGFNTVLPGLNNNLATASGNIGNLLGGQPSADPTRTANAWFGAGSGMPGSEFVRNRGYDLYRTESENRKERGLKDLLGLLGGVSGNLTPTAGQNLGAKTASDQLALGYGQLGQEGAQFDQNMAFQRWLKGNELGLQAANVGNNYLNSYLNFLR